jgi:hypothetical protein
VEPIRLELKITPDQPATGQLQLANKGKKPVEIALSTGPYRFLDPALKLPSCQDWIRFEPEKLTLAAGASTSVGYTVTPPENLGLDTAGEYLGAILVDEYPTEESGGTERPRDRETERLDPGVSQSVGLSVSQSQSRLTIVPRLALAVYVMVEGKERVEAEITRLTAEKLASEAGGTGGREAAPDLLKMSVILKNLGTVHVRPSGTTALFEEDGHLYHTAPLGKSMPLLPTAAMTIPSLLPLPPEGRYRWVVTAEIREGTVLQKESSFEVTPEGEVVQEKKE